MDDQREPGLRTAGGSRHDSEVTAAARKPRTSHSPSTPRPKSAAKAPRKADREVARIVDLRLAKLRNEFKAWFDAHDARVRRQLEELAKTNPIVRAALESSTHLSDSVSPEQMTAREEFVAEVLKHNDEPSDDDVEAMVRSWRE
jgi:hypothetical protein